LSPQIIDATNVPLRDESPDTFHLMDGKTLFATSDFCFYFLFVAATDSIINRRAAEKSFKADEKGKKNLMLSRAKSTSAELKRCRETEH
jgi:hypothetical protein